MSGHEGHERPLGREQIDQLAAAGHLDAGQREYALELVGLSPDARDWERFLSRLFLLSAMLLLIGAIGFFIAYNWDAMGRFAKIALLEAALVAAIVVTARFADHDFRGRVGLLAAVLLTGPLLALVGQTYQTGADTYELFSAWALLTLPWVWIARWRIAWCVWLIVGNCAIALYFTEVRQPIWGSVFVQQGALWHLLANATLLALLELFGQRSLVGGGRSIERFAVALVLAAGAFLYFDQLFGQSGRAPWAVAVAFTTFAAILVVYRYQRSDLVALALWSFAAIACAAATMAKLSLASAMSAGGLLLTGLTVIGLSAAAAVWLRGIRNEHGEES